MAGKSMQASDDADLVSDSPRAGRDVSRDVVRMRKRVKLYSRLRSGAPGGTRTPDLLVRSQTLYPTELRALDL